MKFFSNEPLIALTSDASIDFAPIDFDQLLTGPQQQYLKAQTGKDIPQVFWRKQVHGNDVLTAKAGVSSCQGCPDADAYVTNEKNLPIAIRTADCVPLFFYDPHKQAIGLAHAGWKGTHLNIACKTVETMQDKFNSQCYDLRVVIGPCIRSCCYQVGEEFVAHFPDEVMRREGKLYVDIAAANRRQLMQAGLLAQHIEDTGICTMCQPKYFSFRRDGAKAGRMISLMMLL